ncbi:PREDICTED: uncharacterized protein LOC108557911 [Nicrophorus vespilloides]|uniref:Uncharacterized protein LOC108557911 n=1 Tax=Nicrophorus vespilloides TaxID=110193 RepID=A0ABM1M6B3_NICVS|nr:PREDICTED: uncharacterized protein LOC108557911 [Nicrophorus vespilloides]
MIFYNVNVVGSVWHLIYTFSKETVNYLEIADDLSIIIAILSVMCVLSSYVVKFEDMKELRLEMGNFTVYDKPKDVEQLNAKLDFFSKLFMIWLFGSCLYLWILLTFENCEDGSIDICGFLVGVYLPLDIFSSPYRELYLAFQCYTCYGCTLTAFYVSYSLLGMCSFMKNRVDYLIVMLKTIATIESRSKETIDYLEIADDLSIIISVLSVMCVFAAYMGKFDELKELRQEMGNFTVYDKPKDIEKLDAKLNYKVKFVPIIHLSGWFVALGMNCIFGQQLIDSVLLIKQSVY